MQKSDWVKIRIAADEKAAFQQAADLSGISLSAWMRERLRRITIAELEQSGITAQFLKKSKD